MLLATIYAFQCGKDDDLQAVFVKAARRFVERWGCMPAALALHPETEEIRTDGLIVIHSTDVPRRALFLLIPDDVPTRAAERPQAPAPARSAGQRGVIA